MRKLKVMFLGILFLMVNIVLLIESPYYMLVHSAVISIIFIISGFKGICIPYIIELSVGVPWAIVFIIYFKNIF